MLFCARLKKERVKIKTLAYIFAIPFISTFYGILNPTTATAVDENPQDLGGTGTTNAGTSSASSEVIPTDTSVVPAQGPLAEASTAVATAVSTITTLETKLTQIAEVASSISQPSPVVIEFVQNATSSVASAATTTQTSSTAVTTAQAVVVISEAANQTLTEATAVVVSQVAVVEQASTAVATAQSAVTTTTTTFYQENANLGTLTSNLLTAQTAATNAAADASAANTTSTTTETFANNSTSVVTVTTGPGVFIGGNWNTPQTSGPGLVLQSPQNDVVINVNPTNTGTVTSVTMGVYAKNGDTNMTATNADGSTSVEVINNNVSSETQAVQYTSTETITGSSIKTLTITKDNDYYIIDNIAITKTSSDPALVAAATEAAAALASAQAAHDAQLVVRDASHVAWGAAHNAANTAQATLSTEQGTLTALQTIQSTAQTEATTAEATAEVAATTALSSSHTSTSSVAEAVVAIAETQIVVSAAAVETISNTLQTVVTSSDALPLQKTEIVAVVDAAVDAVVEAQESVEEARAAMGTATTFAETAPTVDAATAVVLDKTEVLSQAQAAVDAQEVIVASATATEAAAQAVVNANIAPGLKVEVYAYNGAGSPALPAADATPIRTFTDTNGINEQWSNGAVAGSSRADRVIVKYSGDWTPTFTGTTYLSAQADDGTKLYLDGVLVANDWVDKGGGGSTVEIATTAGVSKDFILWFYENGGGAAVTLIKADESTNGFTVVSGSEFSQSSATAEQVQALNSAKAIVEAEQNELEVLDLEEDAAQQNLVDAQQNLAVAEQAVQAMETAVSLAQIAIIKTVEAIEAVQVADTVVQQEIILQSPIEAPTNIVVVQLENGDVQVSWDPPTGVIAPERYAISWSIGDGGWGIATGNAGDENALNTTIILSASLFEGTGGLDTTYQISVRSDNDSLSKYSSVVATEMFVIDTTPPPPPPPAPEPTPEPQPEPEVIPEPEPTPEEPPVEPEEPPVEPEEPPVEPEEPPVEPEEPPVEPEEPPVEPEEPPAETTKEEIDAAVDDAIGDGKLSAQDAEDILDALGADGEVTKDEVNNLSEALAADGKLTKAEKDLVATALLESVAPGENLTKEQIQDAGIEYKDLPPETPVEVRRDENGNEIVIIAEVAAALELVSDPGALVGAIFTDPAQALLALTSLGADMSEEEREEAEKMVLATVVVGQAVAAAVAVAGTATGGTGSSSGGGTGGGGSGGGAPSGGSATRRRKP